MASNAAQSTGSLPSGTGICCSVPDVFYFPELVFGGLVWILVASSHVIPPNPLGWVMFVSIFCFIVTFIWLVIFLCGAHQNSANWAAADFVYHFLAAFFYLSASVALAYVTCLYGRDEDFLRIQVLDPDTFTKYYRIDIAAVVFSHLATLFYFIHGIMSAVRWRSF